MLLIIRSKTKKLFDLGLKIIIVVFVVSIIVTHLVNMYQGTNVIREGWLREDKPSGSSIRVENPQEPMDASNPNFLDQIVVELKGFYQNGE